MYVCLARLGKVLSTRSSGRFPSLTCIFLIVRSTMLQFHWSVSQNHRMVGVGSDLCGSSSPTLLPKQGHLQKAAQDRVQAGLEYLQRRRLHNLPGQPVPVLRHPLREEALPHVQMELPVPQFVPIAPCPVTGHHWKELGPILQSWKELGPFRSKTQRCHRLLHWLSTVFGFLQTCQLAEGCGAPVEAQGKQKGGPEAQKSFMASLATGRLL